MASACNIFERLCLRTPAGEKFALWRKEQSSKCLLGPGNNLKKFEHLPLWNKVSLKSLSTGAWSNQEGLGKAGLASHKRTEWVRCREKKKLLTYGDVALAEGRDQRKGTEMKEILGQPSEWWQLGVEGGGSVNRWLQGLVVQWLTVY